jgi:hypothetical protein
MTGPGLGAAIEGNLPCSPEHLLADEHHQPRGVKSYIATTVGAGCCLGAALAQTAGAEDLQAADAGFQREAQNVRAGYQPETVSVDGWAATRQAWQALFPLAVPLRCFLYGWLNVRSRGKLCEGFEALSATVWHAYHAASRRGFAAVPGVQRLAGWSTESPFDALGQTVGDHLISEGKP